MIHHIYTESERVVRTRKTSIELLMSDHDGDCRGPCVLKCPASVNAQGYGKWRRAAGCPAPPKSTKDTMPLPMYKRLFSFIILLAATTSAAAQVTLSNGIRLPAEWPPRYPLPTERHEMPVPYLRHKPAVIPINNGRQLFVDSFLISSTTLESVYHTPTYYRGNPVLEPTEKWELTTEGAPYASPFSDGIWYDDREGIFKMWYLAGAGMMHRQSAQTFYTCYAESADGKAWRKVPLDVVPGTNVADTCRRDASTVWLDREETDPSRRWKMFLIRSKPNADKRAKGYAWQLTLKYSPDGRRWSRGVAQSGYMEDRSTAFYNPFTRKWAASMRGATPVSFRSRYYAEHSDPETLVSLLHPVNWDTGEKYIRFWFAPDDKEPQRNGSRPAV